MANIEIKIPNWLDKICAWPVTMYRQWKFGYPYRRIPLGENRFTLVDPHLFYRLNRFHWFAEGQGDLIYAVRNIISADEPAKSLRLHREIMNAPPGLLVDHRNGGTLDNRLDNLRLATHSQNNCNRPKRSNTSSRFIGVSFRKKTKCWQSCTRNNGKTIFLGYFHDEIEAAKAYDRAAIKYHGEFARLNFPRENYINEGEQGKLKEDSQITIRDSSQADKLFRQILATCLICLRPGRRRGESANLT